MHEVQDPVLLEHLLRHLLTARAVEERCIRMVKQGIQPKFFSAWGNEATAVGTAAALDRDDVLVPMHRSLGAHLVRGHSLDEIFLQAFLKDDSHTRGRDTGLHLGAAGTNIIGMISPLGSMNTVAAGIAMAEQLMGQETVVLAYIGDGGTSTGVFHEAMNFIGVRQLPVVTVIENNQWAFGTPNELQFGCETLADRGPAYGMPSVRIDGTDVRAVYEATKEAVHRARAGQGPALIESLTMRMRGHAEHDDMAYVPDEMVDEWGQRDPVTQYLQWLRDGNHLPELDVDALRASIEQEVLEASDRARAASDPNPASALTGVFHETADGKKPDRSNSSVSVAPTSEVVGERAAETASRLGEGRTVEPIPTPGTEVSYIDAIRHCLHHHLQSDPRTVLLGQDIGLMGGAFRATRGLSEQFGPQRVVDTPISEGAIIGGCIGLAIRGLRPVAEMQFADFVCSTFNELVNNAGTFRYRIGVGVPMVVRLPSAGGIGAGPFHSLNPEAWFAHSPGLKVVVPSTVEDAWGLLNTAIDDEDPVLFLEQKYYYRRAKGPLPDPEHRVPLGCARKARAGKDATVVTWGVGLDRSLEAADSLAARGVGDVEVLDLRSIVPWDKEAISQSVRQTSRLLVVHEARNTCGFGSEIAAWAAEELFEWLDAPVRRVTGADVPTPSHKELEKVTTPQTPDVIAALEELLGW
ncbi:MAG: dehydrogenase [Deltaproteobacteria bacterium]|nr:dehydrogenase [Deltaproteobacteria bacterium]